MHEPLFGRDDKLFLFHDQDTVHAGKGCVEMTFAVEVGGETELTESSVIIPSNAELGH